MIDESSFVALCALILVLFVIMSRGWTHGINNFILIVCESIEVLGDRVFVLASLLVGATVSCWRYA